MATREIKTRFRLEGESEYRRAMKESAEAIKVLTSEQKLAAAEFEATGDAQEYASETARILKDQIREQEKAVQAAQQAVEKLKAAGVDPADKSMQQWNTRLNTAKTRLLNMQNQLTKANTDLQTNKGKLDESEGSAKGFGDQLDRIGKNIDFTATITAIDNLKGKIEGILKTAARAAKGFWDMQTDAGKWADDLATAASQAGMDVETYQSWQYASQFIDAEVSKISSTITRLEKDLGSGNKEIAIAFNRLQVSTRAAGVGVRDATAVFWDVIDALHKIEDPTKRSIYAQQLLGQSWKDLNPLIEAGSQAYKNLAKEGLETATVSEENVSKLGEMNDAQNKLNSSIQKAKFDTLAALAPTFTEVSNALNTAVGALNEFLQSQEGQEALGKLNEALSGVIQSFLGEDGGKGTFKSIVEGASGAIENFNGLLDWIGQNGETVKGIVLGLVAAWGTLTISKDVLTLLQLLQHIPLSKLTAAFGSKEAAEAAGAAGAASAAGAAGTAAAGAAGSTLSGLVTNAFSGASAVINAAFSKLGLVGIGTLTGVPMLDFLKDPSKYTNAEAQKKYDELNVDPLSGLRSAAKNPNAVKEGLWALLGAGDSSTAKEATEKIAEETADTMRKTVTERISSANWEELFKKDPENDIWKQIFGDFDLEWVKQNWQQAAPYMLDTILKETQNKDYFIELGQESADATAAGIESEKDRFNVAGENAAVGFANGLLARAQDVYDAGKALAQTAQDAMKTDLDIQSPSKVMARLGAFTAQGFAEGIDRGMSDVERAVSRMAGAAFRAPLMAAPQMPRAALAAPGVPGAPAADAGAAGQKIQAGIMMDKRVVGYMVAPAVNEAIGAIVEEMRA